MAQTRRSTHREQAIVELKHLLFSSAPVGVSVAAQHYLRCVNDNLALFSAERIMIAIHEAKKL